MLQGWPVLEQWWVLVEGCLNQLQVWRMRCGNMIFYSCCGNGGGCLYGSMCIIGCCVRVATGLVVVAEVVDVVKGMLTL